MLSHHPSSLSQIWGRRGSRAQRALQHVQQIQLHALTGSPDLPWKWQHVNACWGARPSTPPVADSLEVNFPVAHQLYFLFSVKPPIQTLPDLPVRMLSPGNLSVLLHNEQCHSHQGRDRRGQGLGCQTGRLILASLKRRRDLQSFRIKHDLLGHFRVSWKQVSSKVWTLMLSIH